MKREVPQLNEKSEKLKRFQNLIENGDFSDAQKRYFQKLVNQYWEISDAGKTIKQLQEEGKIEQARLLIAIIKELKMFKEEKMKAPEKIIEIPKGYDSDETIVVNGEIYILAYPEDPLGKEIIIREDGNLIEDGAAYVENVIIIDGKLAWVKQKENGMELCNEDGKIFESDLSYHRTVEVDGEVFFLVRNNLFKNTVLNAAGDKVFSNTGFFFDDSDIFAPVAYRGQKFYHVLAPNHSNSLVMESGNTVFSNYDGLKELQVIGDRLVMAAKIGDRWTIIDKDENDLGGDFKDIYSINDIGGEMYVVIAKDSIEEDSDNNNDDSVIYGIFKPDGEIMEKDFHSCPMFYNVDGKINIVSSDTSSLSLQYIYDENGEKISSGFMNINFVGKNEGGKFMCVKLKKDHCVFLDENEEQFGPVYKSFIGSYNFQGNDLFVMLEGGDNKGFCVTDSKGRRLSGYYEIITGIEEINGKIYVIGNLGDGNFAKQEVLI